MVVQRSVATSYMYRVYGVGQVGGFTVVWSQGSESLWFWDGEVGGGISLPYPRF